MAYVDMTARFTYNLQTVFGDFNKLANNDAYMKAHGWADGTVGVFFQAAAPTGWTKITTADARALRLVSGAGGGVAGSQDPATTITLAHTHVIASDAAHTHALQTHSHHLAASGTDRSSGNLAAVGALNDGSGTQEHDLAVAGGSIFPGYTKKNSLAMTGSYTSGSGGAHDHGGVSSSSLTNISLAYIDVLFCSKDTTSGYTDLTTTFVHNTRHVFDYLEQLTQNDAYNYTRRTPAGTVSLFGLAAAPTGWTKLTTQNAQLLRVVSGTGGGSGGTADPATAITLAHTHTISNDGAHTHSMPAHYHSLDNVSSGVSLNSGLNIGADGAQLAAFTVSVGAFITTKADYTDTSGSGTSSDPGTHSHTPVAALSDITLAYFNVIQASKDSIGAPASYTDRTGFFVDQALLAYQDLQYMADNDAYLYYHTMPAAAVMFFFQSAAPLNWTKSTSHDDKILRIVSGSTGGTADGTSPFSSSFQLAHVHALDSQSHTHTLAHTHALTSGSARHSNGTGFIANRKIYGAADADLYYAANTGAGDFPLGYTTDSQSVSTDSYAHAHGGATASGLSNITIAYADVIMCTKN